MKLVYGSIGAAVGGMVGAAIWAAIAYYFHYEIAWIAMGIGALCGFGMAICVRDEGNALSGVIAAVITVAAICGGKYITIDLILSDVTASLQGEDGIKVTAETAQLYMADQLVAEAQSAGKKLVWPGGKEPEDGITEPSEAPKEIWKDVQARWSAMDKPAQDQYITAIQAEIDQFLKVGMGAARDETFLESFELIDIVFFAAAIYMAFKCGSGLFDGQEE
jgi:phosphate/sulfate permease